MNLLLFLTHQLDMGHGAKRKYACSEEFVIKRSPRFRTNPSRRLRTCRFSGARARRESSVYALLIELCSVYGTYKSTPSARIQI
jgi:hypothetical protein